MQEQAVTLVSELPEGQADDISELAGRIGDLAEAIVLRQVLDADEAFDEIGGTVARLQDATKKTDASANANIESGEDEDLIAAWIGSCDGMLSDLEGRFLALERSPNDSDEIAGIRRTLHTLKGECGVLSLHTAQGLCHEAETLIDARLDANQHVPIDPLLALVDWLKSYVSHLSSDSTAKPSNDQAIMDLLLAAQNSVDDSKSAETTASTVGTSTSPAESPAQHETSTVGSASTMATSEAQASATTTLAFSPQPGTEENLPDFLCEAHDHITNSEEALLALDQDGTDIELINTVFRAFHTIKGVSGFMGLKPIVSLAHSAEQLLDGARSGTVQLGRSELDLVLASCDMMTKLLDVLEGTPGPTQGDFETLIHQLDAAAGKSSPEHPAPQLEQPQVAAPTQSSSAPTSDIAAGSSPPDATKGNTSASPSKSRKMDQTVKVNTTRMDNLVTMVGELVIAQQMVVQDVTGVIELADDGQRVQRTLSHMGKMVRDLQEVSMSLRMVNLKSTFQKMTRLVRDVSQKADKQIEVVTEGEDVELDRNVVEAITDPLVHMIRNSCDHGVEGIEDRKAAGKSATGRVSLRAYHSGGSIVIEIADDGRGLRRENLIAKAKSKGVIPQDIDDSLMPDSEVFALIFKPGFSTAEQVTDISGRGVGMDVVRRNIEALRGKIEIQSTPGEGTTFLMRLPLTMAIIDGMVVRVGTQRYVLPTLSIQQSFRPKSGDVKTTLGTAEMVKVRGSMLPVYRLNRVLQLDEGFNQIADALLIVMEADNSRFCLMVDEIIGQHQVVIKTLTQTGQQLQGVSGGAILGDGRVALILDVAQVVELARESSCDAAALGHITTEVGALGAAV